MEDEHVLEVDSLGSTRGAGSSGARCGEGDCPRGVEIV